MHSEHVSTTAKHLSTPPLPPPSAHVQRYVKIAAMLPRKSVRDVALRCRWTLNQQLLKKRKPGEPLVPPAGGLGGAKKPLGAGPGLLPPKAPALPPVPMVRADVRLLLVAVMAVIGPALQWGALPQVALRLAVHPVSLLPDALLRHVFYCAAVCKRSPPCCTPI